MRYDSNGEPKFDVPLWLRLTLTLDEANALSGIGIGKLRELAKKEDCPFILWNGGKHLRPECANRASISR